LDEENESKEVNMKTNDHISRLGYSRNSPYAANPYLDIHSPEGKITMANTDIDLLGIDNVGNMQYMKAGTKNPYQFEGDTIREIPIKQRGGYSRQQIAQDFFDYTDEDNYVESAPEASHVAEEIPQQPEVDYKLLYEQKLQEEMDNYAVQIANTEDEYIPRRNSATSFSGMDPNFSSSNFHLPGSSGFQSFGSYQEGRSALERQLELYKSGKSAHTKGTETLAQATSIYAPPSENNTQNYINFVSKQLGVSANTPISQIDTKKWADAIEKMEGNTKGNNPGNLRKVYQKGGVYRKLK